MFYLRHSFISGLAVFALLVSCGGCFHTFRSQRIHNDAEPFWGTPTTVYRPAIATVQWAQVDGQETKTTQHYCKIPALYSTDVCKAPLGTTTATFDYHPDGQLKGAKGVVDQQVDDFIKAVAGAADQFGGGQRGGDTLTDFVPSITNTRANLMTNNPGKDYVVTSMTFQEIN